MIDITPQEIKKIDKQYEYHFDMMTEEDDMVRKAKWALHQIDVPDRIIFELYSELKSSRKVGKILGVSHYIVLREIRRIREEIIRYINNAPDV